MWEILPGTQTQALNFLKSFQQTFHLSKQTWNSPAYYYLNSKTYELTDLGWIQVGFLILHYMYPTVISSVDFISGNAIETNATGAFNTHSRSFIDTKMQMNFKHFAKYKKSMTIDCYLIFLVCNNGYCFFIAPTLNCWVYLRLCLCANINIKSLE